MQPDATDLGHLSQVISHATAPAFLLGAVPGLISILITRMNGIIDRVRTLNTIPDDDDQRAHLKSDIPRPKHRAQLINQAIYRSVGSGICTTVLVILAFASALIGIRHEQVVALLFVLALALLGAALFTFAREVRIASTSSTTMRELALALRLESACHSTAGHWISQSWRDCARPALASL